MYGVLWIGMITWIGIVIRMMRGTMAIGMMIRILEGENSFRVAWDIMDDDSRFSRDIGACC